MTRHQTQAAGLFNRARTQGQSHESAAADVEMTIEDWITEFRAEGLDPSAMIDLLEWWAGYVGWI